MSGVYPKARPWQYGGVFRTYAKASHAGRRYEAQHIRIRITFNEHDTTGFPYMLEFQGASIRAGK